MSRHHPSASVATDAEVSSDVPVGAGSVIGSGAMISTGCEIGANVRVGRRATLLPPDAPAGIGTGALRVRDDVTIGPGSVICGPTTIGQGATVRPGAVVLADVPPHAVVAGNPAEVTGYVAPAASTGIGRRTRHVSAPEEAGTVPVIGGSTLIRFPTVEDLRGRLTFGEFDEHLPFLVHRCFMVYGVPSSSIRGEHAHRTLHELLICASGTVSVSLTDGHERCEVQLDDPSVGLHIPPFVWSTQYRHSATSALVVLCSEPYDPDSYIRNFDEFMDVRS